MFFEFAAFFVLGETFLLFATLLLTLFPFFLDGRDPVDAPDLRLIWPGFLPVDLPVDVFAACFVFFEGGSLVLVTAFGTCLSLGLSEPCNKRFNASAAASIDGG